MEPMCENLVFLSTIGHYNNFSNRLSAVMCENPEKPIFLTFFGPNRISLHLKLPFFFLVHIFLVNG